MLYVFANKDNLAHIAVVATLVPQVSRALWYTDDQFPACPGLKQEIVLLLHPAKAWAPDIQALLDNKNVVWSYGLQFPGVKVAGEDIFHCLRYGIGAPLRNDLNYTFKEYTLLHLQGAPNFMGTILYWYIEVQAAKTGKPVTAMAEKWKMTEKQLADLLGKPDLLIAHDRLSACYAAKPSAMQDTRYGNCMVVVATTHVAEHQRSMWLKSTQCAKDTPIDFTLVVIPPQCTAGAHTMVDWVARGASPELRAAWIKDHAIDNLSARSGQFQLPKDNYMAWLDDLHPSWLRRLITFITD